MTYFAQYLRDNEYPCDNIYNYCGTVRDDRKLSDSDYIYFPLECDVINQNGILYPLERQADSVAVYNGKRLCELNVLTCGDSVVYAVNIAGHRDCVTKYSSSMDAKHVMNFFLRGRR